MSPQPPQLRRRLLVPLCRLGVTRAVDEASLRRRVVNVRKNRAPLWPLKGLEKEGFERLGVEGDRISIGCGRSGVGV